MCNFAKSITTITIDFGVFYIYKPKVYNSVT